MGEEHDINGDGLISDAEERHIELDNLDKKEDQQRRLAAVAMYSMVILTMLLLSPLISAERVEALSDLLTMFYIAQAGVVATFFGASAYMNVNR